MLGSGNPEIPCLRIHADTASIRACACEDGGSEPGGPFGSRRWHACAADWNAGDSTVLCEPIRTVWPLTVGSGKFGTPCERMHLENATPDSTALAVDAEVLAPPVGLLERPPHPVTSTALRRAAAVSRRGSRPGEPAWYGCCTAFGSSLFASVVVQRERARGAARVNTGDCWLIVLGNTRITPSISLNSRRCRSQAGSDGTEVRGSGKS